MKCVHVQCGIYMYIDIYIFFANRDYSKILE